MHTMSLRPILVAEDNADDVESLKRIFRKLKIQNEVHVVSDGGQAICYLKGEGLYADRERYPLPVMLLLDLVMDGGGGLAVLEWLQNQPKRDFPIIILTGMQHLRQMQAAYRMGAHSFIMKPVAEAEILPLVRAFKGIEMSQ